MTMMMMVVVKIVNCRPAALPPVKMRVVVGICLVFCDRVLLLLPPDHLVDVVAVQPHVPHHPLSEALRDVPVELAAVATVKVATRFEILEVKGFEKRNS